MEALKDIYGRLMAASLLLVSIPCMGEVTYRVDSYHVKENEKLEQIVRRYSGLPNGYELVAEVGRIAQLNGIKNIHLLEKGQLIILNEKKIKKNEVKKEKIVVKRVKVETKNNHQVSVQFGVSKSDANVEVDSVNNKVRLKREYETEATINYMYSPDDSNLLYGGYIGGKNTIGISIGVGF